MTATLAPLPKPLKRLGIITINAIEDDFRKLAELETFSEEEFQKLRRLCQMARNNANSASDDE